MHRVFRFVTLVPICFLVATPWILGQPCTDSSSVVTCPATTQCTSIGQLTNNGQLVNNPGNGIPCNNGGQVYNNPPCNNNVPVYNNGPVYNNQPYNNGYPPCNNGPVYNNVPYNNGPIYNNGVPCNAPCPVQTDTVILATSTEQDVGDAISILFDSGYLTLV